ncbi:MAG: hypothetical protein ACE15E_16070 [Acidobacteriota bacterium]
MKFRVFIPVCLLVCCSLSWAEERRPPASLRSVELQNVLSRVPGARNGWRIAEAAGEQNLLARLGTAGFPLRLLNANGRVSGEVYRIEESGKYQGLVLLRSRSAAEIRSAFFARKWPLEQLSKALKAMDADDPLKEPDVHLAIDEDRLVLRVNLGKVEREFEFMRLDPKEVRGQ